MPCEKIFEKFMEDNQEMVCKTCADVYYDGSVNSGPWNLCEGRHCKDMEEYFKEEIMERGKELPQLWCLKVDFDNVEEVKAWRLPVVQNTLSLIGYICNKPEWSTDRFRGYWSKERPPIDYEEITFEDFQRLVLNKVKPINKKEDEDTKENPVKVQGSYFKTGVSDIIRGTGIKGTGSKIKIRS